MTIITSYFYTIWGTLKACPNIQRMSAYMNSHIICANNNPIKTLRDSADLYNGQLKAMVSSLQSEIILPLRQQ